MESLQFVACSDGTCSYNKDRNCLAKAIDISKDGQCATKGTQAEQSPTPTYVNLRECACSKCQYWKLDDATKLGQCGYNAELFFMNDKPDTNPVCFEFHKQAQRV